MFQHEIGGVLMQDETGDECLDTTRTSLAGSFRYAYYRVNCMSTVSCASMAE